jgi:hypothetical protein
MCKNMNIYTYIDLHSHGMFMFLHMNAYIHIHMNAYIHTYICIYTELQYGMLDGSPKGRSAANPVYLTETDMDRRDPESEPLCD